MIGYHVTNAGNLPAILRHGLRVTDPGVVRGGSPGSGNPPGVYLWAELGDALAWPAEPGDLILCVDARGLPMGLDPDNQIGDAARRVLVDVEPVRVTIARAIPHAAVA